MFEKKLIINKRAAEVTEIIKAYFDSHIALECAVQDETHLRIQSKTYFPSKDSDPFQLDLYLKSLDQHTELTLADSGSSFILVFQIVAYMGTWIAAPAIALSTEGRQILPKLFILLPAVTLVVWLLGRFFRLRTTSVVRKITGLF